MELKYTWSYLWNIYNSSLHLHYNSLQTEIESIVINILQMNLYKHMHL